MSHRELDDIASGHGGEDIPAEVTDEAAKPMLEDADAEMRTDVDPDPSDSSAEATQANQAEDTALDVPTDARGAYAAVTGSGGSLDQTQAQGTSGEGGGGGGGASW